MKKELEKFKTDRRNSRLTHNISNTSRYSIQRPLEDISMLNSSINSNSTNMDRKSGLEESSMLDMIDMSLTSNYALKEDTFTGFDEISKIKHKFTPHSSYLR